LFADIHIARVSGTPIEQRTPPCDSVNKGYECQPETSHYWGQYSPYFSVPSDISSDLPPFCEISFAQVLSRHGARDPTASKTLSYNATIQKIKTNVKSFTGEYAFLATYHYTLGADQLTVFGQQEMINSGIKFYNRYSLLSKVFTPFFRSASEDRVVESAQNFTQGFHQAKNADKTALHSTDKYPYNIEIILEADGSNNTLNHDLCTAFEDGPDSKIASAAQAKWAAIFVPPILTRLNTDLPGANLAASEVIYIMDLCPFNTVASPTGQVSPFCALFTEKEWKEYDYYETLGKYYGYGQGNPLGPTQGVGFTNELIARLTSKPVVDETSSNHTLDDNKATFPIGHQFPLYADFSHDNDMTAMFNALGLYNSTPTLSQTQIMGTDQTNGYSAAWSVSFAARAYFEKMICLGQPEELIRVIVNDRVIPLPTCDSDKYGRCKLSKFVSSLSFAKGNGHWDQCFV
jgi:Histidine phosphatase superfamily (branch 2)